MASINRFSRSVSASPDINEPVETIKRDRTTRLAGALGGLALVTAGLLAMPFLDFRQGFDPGPAETAPAYQVDRGASDQGSSTMINDTVNNQQTEPTMLPPAEMPQQAAPDTTDQGSRGMSDSTSAPDNQGAQGAPSSDSQ